MGYLTLSTPRQKKGKVSDGEFHEWDIIGNAYYVSDRLDIITTNSKSKTQMPQLRMQKRRQRLLFDLWN